MQAKQMFRCSHLPIWLLIFVLFVTSCSKNSEQPEPQYLVKATPITELTKATIDASFSGQAAGASQIIAGLTKYNVKVYKITYKTKDLNNNDIQASGAVIIPVTTDKIAIVSYQHGTIREDREAPSNFARDSEAGLLSPLFASIGYIISAPDYLGYGDSKQLPHPYEHRQSLATASIDMLRATREFCQQQGINVSEKLFLTGYSLGGFATMSMQKMMEDQFANEFKITASVMGAGAYNKTAFSQYVLSQNTNLSFVNNYIWVLQTYNAVYGLNRPLNTIFTEPNAARIQQQGPFASNISQNPQELFLPAFRTGIVNGTDAAFMNALKDNDVFDWQPRVPTLLVHGRSDDFVIPLNSQTAFDAMRRRGATNIELALVDGNHFSAVTPYVLQMYGFFFRFNN